MDLEWQDPPDNKNAPHLAVDIATELRKRPYTWARVLGPTTSGKVESLRVMLVHNPPAGIELGEFEAQRRSLATGDGNSVCLWARYVGNGSEVEE